MTLLPAFFSGPRSPHLFPQSRIELGICFRSKNSDPELGACGGLRSLSHGESAKGIQSLAP